ncbi:ABC transporter permease [Leucobacter albus]|uniref:ABC transporter permease n=1 Tax=Leucobacter albus TaxID=272210 RepID=A0ABW3TUB8_9MICO
MNTPTTSKADKADQAAQPAQPPQPTQAGPARKPPHPLPGILRTGARRAAFEIRGYFRAGDTVFFTFLFPVMMLVIFSAAFSSQGNIGTAADGSGGVSIATYYMTGMLAAGMLLSGTQGLGIDIAVEKSEGTLARLGASPLSPVSYFIGKFGQVLVTGTVQAALILLVARFAFGVELPSEPGRWLTFAWVFLLGTAVAALLGVALSAVPRTGKSATAVVLPPVLILQFISGVYLQFSMLPEWLQNIASVFPLRWMAQGMRAAFLPEVFATAEPAGEWGLGLVCAVLVGWLIAGVALSALTFRWSRRS